MAESPTSSSTDRPLPQGSSFLSREQEAAVERRFSEYTKEGKIRKLRAKAAGKHYVPTRLMRKVYIAGRWIYSTNLDSPDYKFVVQEAHQDEDGRRYWLDKKIVERGVQSVISEGRIDNLKLNTTEYNYRITQLFPSTSSAILEVSSLLDHLYQKGKIHQSDAVSYHVTIGGVTFSTKSVQFDSIPEVSEALVEGIEAQYRSEAFVGDTNKGFTGVKVTIIVRRVPIGGNRTKPFTYEALCKKKYSYVVIKNTDQLCLPRAIAVVANRDRPDAMRISDSTRAIQRTLALELCEKASIPTDKPMGLVEVKKFEAVLNAQICVLEDLDMHYIYKPKYQEGKSQYYVHKYGEHYNAITDMAKLMGMRQFCHVCKRAYDRTHTCASNMQCPVCKVPHKWNADEEADQYCEACNRWFTSLCYENHLKGVCQRYFFCSTCNKVVTRKNYGTNTEHKCGFKSCGICKVDYEEGTEHLCYMQRPKALKIGNDYIYYDIESMHVGKVHVANLICATKVTEGGVMKVDFALGDRAATPTENPCMDEFCRWLFSGYNKGFTVIAYNGKGYDFHFIYHWLLRHPEYTPPPDPIMTGRNITCMRIGGTINIRFVDSCLFLQAPLRLLPTTYGLTTIKGDFPYLFDIPNHRTYRGPIPDRKYFNLAGRSKKEVEEFTKWYDDFAKSGAVYDIQVERLKYCRADVQVLREACEAFRAVQIEKNAADPFQYNTPAKYCNTVFRYSHMKENTIGINMVHDAKAHSLEAACWIEDVMEKEHIHIQHAYNGGEVKIDGMYVDGYCKETDTIYEYNGCRYHGCPQCYPDRRKFDASPDVRSTPEKLYKDTLIKQNMLQESHNLVVKWSHEYKPGKATLKRRKEAMAERTPLRPREAFFGGRTEVFKLYYKGAMQYDDFNSMYPSVNYYCMYPLGHQTQIIAPEVNTYKPGKLIIEGGYLKDYEIGSHFGLIKCKVLPPRDLYYPVLPQHISDKLMFVLCEKCALVKCTNCTHSDAERAMIGTWCTCELDLALMCGYKLLHIYEIHDFKNRSKDLFKSYIAKFYQAKQEASGCPKGMTKQEYIAQQKTLYGFTMKEEDIERNEGKRAPAKLMLNSFWGRFGLRDNLPKVKVFSDQASYNEFWLNPKLKDKTALLVTEDVVECSYVESDPVDTGAANIYIAAFTTAWARIKIHSFLTHLGDKGHYCDTDSCIYAGDKPGIKHSPELGMLVSDVSYKPITEYVGLSPKNYSVVIDGVAKVKVKGVNNKEGYINMEMMKALLREPWMEEHVPQVRFDKDKDHVISTTEFKKKYRFLYDKRMRYGDYDTLPWGYVLDSSQQQKVVDTVHIIV